MQSTQASVSAGPSQRTTTPGTVGPQSVPGAWYVLEARSTRADLWVRLEGPGKPELGPWLTPAGDDVHALVGTGELVPMGEAAWFRRHEYSRGTRRGDLLWTGGGQYVLLSERMRAVLLGVGDPGIAFHAVQIRDRGESAPHLEGYSLLVPNLSGEGHMRSEVRGLPTSRLVVTGAVLAALLAAGVDGFDWESYAPSPSEAGDLT